MSAPVRVAVVGQTASGKSALALDLLDALGEGSASTHPGVVINADASQLYRGMDIGTAKLPPAQRRGITHHQLDVLDVTQEASVAAYQRHARADAARATATDPAARVVIVGGSGLYVRALTDNLTFPGTDPAVRAALTARLAADGAPSLWAELARLDPVSAGRIEPANTRRLVRALEVIELTGEPFSATLPAYEDAVPTVHLALRAVPDDGAPARPGDDAPPASARELAGRAALAERIAARARTMLDSGLLDEVRALLDAGLREGPTASRAIGYSQAISVIDGRLTREQAVADTALATRQLAARQLKWFRRDPRIHWLELPTAPDGTVTDQAWDAVVTRAARLVRAADTAAHRPDRVEP